METLNSSFIEYIKQAVSLSKSSTHITEDNVFQEADLNILPFLDKMVDALVLPGSGVDGMENLEELLDKAESGKSCLLLPEHYSNMDLSLISSLIRYEGGRGESIAKAIVAIAGMKLSEDNPVVSTFASAYSRVIIFPSRSLQELDAEKDRAVIVRSNGINRAAMKALLNIKTKGRLILVFPSGTRYRPWDPSTKRGVREIDSYIKSFDYMCPVAINGEVLHVRQGDMMEDSVSRDLVRITAGPVMSCSDFRDRVLAEVDAANEAVKAAAGADAAVSDYVDRLIDKKQSVADSIMAILEEMHVRAEEKRELLQKKSGA